VPPHLTFGRKKITINVKLLVSKYLWIAVLLVIGLFYMALVGFGVVALVELLANRGIIQPWLGIIKMAGFITAFISLLYPMYFVKLLEEGLMRHGPVFAKGPFLSQRPMKTSVDDLPAETEQAEQGVAPNRSLPPTLNSTSSVRGSEDF
jgi:hypothetical protein